MSILACAFACMYTSILGSSGWDKHTVCFHHANTPVLLTYADRSKINPWYMSVDDEDKYVFMMQKAAWGASEVCEPYTQQELWEYLAYKIGADMGNRINYCQEGIKD